VSKFVEGVGDFLEFGQVSKCLYVWGLTYFWFKSTAFIDFVRPSLEERTFEDVRVVIGVVASVESSKNEIRVSWNFGNLN
jgi:hypothetical protein